MQQFGQMQIFENCIALLACLEFTIRLKMIEFTGSLLSHFRPKLLDKKMKTIMVQINWCRFRLPPGAALILLPLTLAIMLLSPNVVAQSNTDPNPNQRINELERKLQRSQETIDALLVRIQALESAVTPGKSAASAPAAVPATAKPASPAEDMARIAELERNVKQLSANASGNASMIGVPLRGFFDVGYAQRTGTKEKGARYGGLSFYLTPELGGNFKSLAELIFEVDREGGLVTDFERLQVGYTVNDALTLWTGRYHTPYGYWNTAFHHGAQIQTSIMRPSFIDLEDKGGILPAHSVGIWATGHIPIGGVRLAYDLYVANAHRIDLENGPGTGILNAGNVGSANGRATIGGNLGIQFRGGLEGLKVGGHWLTSKTEIDLGAMPAVDVRMAGAYLVYDQDNWEVMGETYHFNNRSQGQSRRSNAGFLQVGKNFDSITVFGRTERTSLALDDPFFSQQAFGRSYTRNAVGLKYDFSPVAAFKFELFRHRQVVSIVDAYTEGQLQLAIRF